MLVSVDLIVGCYAGREDVSLADVLHFLIGADKIPAMGFTVSPSINFTDMEILPNP